VSVITSITNATSFLRTKYNFSSRLVPEQVLNFYVLELCESGRNLTTYDSVSQHWKSTTLKIFNKTSKPVKAS